MPDNEQARTDDMPNTPKPHHKRLSTIVILAVFIGVIAVVVFL